MSENCLHFDKDRGYTCKHCGHPDSHNAELTALKAELEECRRGLVRPHETLEIAKLKARCEAAEVESLAYQMAVNPLEEKIKQLESELAAAKAQLTMAESYKIVKLREAIVKLELALSETQAKLEEAQNANKVLVEIEARLRKEFDDFPRWFDAVREVKEYEELIAMQKKRMEPAWKMWQQAKNEPNTWPDLGDLLQFLLDRIAAQEKWIERAKSFCDNFRIYFAHLRQDNPAATFFTEGREPVQDELVRLHHSAEDLWKAFLDEMASDKKQSGKEGDGNV